MHSFTIILTLLLDELFEPLNMVLKNLSRILHRQLLKAHYFNE